MSESQKCNVNDVDGHYSDAAFDYTVPNKIGPVLNPVVPNKIGQHWDEAFDADSSSLPDPSLDVHQTSQGQHNHATGVRVIDPGRYAAGGRASIVCNDRSSFYKQSARISNEESGASRLLPVSGGSHKSKAADVDQSLKLQLGRPVTKDLRGADIEPAKVRCASASTEDVAQRTGEKNILHIRPLNATTDMPSCGREPVFDENGNPLESLHGASQYCQSPKNMGDMLGSSTLHRITGKDRDGLDHRNDKDSAYSTGKTRNKKSSKDNKGILAENIPGHRGTKGVDELLLYINGSKQPVEAASVTNGDKLEKKIKRATEKGKKSGHEISSTSKFCESKPAGKLSSSFKHLSVAEGEIGANKATVSINDSTATNNIRTDRFQEEQRHNDAAGCEDAAGYVTAFAVPGSDNVNVSSTVTTFETCSVVLFAKVPSGKPTDHKLISSTQDEPVDTASTESIPWQSDRSLDVQASESFLYVGKKKKFKDSSNQPRCVAVNVSRQIAAQANHRLHGSSVTFAASASCDSLAPAASFKDAETHAAGCSHDASLLTSKGAIESLLTNGHHYIQVDFSPTTPVERRGESLTTGSVAAAGADSSAAAYIALFDDASQKRTWAKVASKPATASLIDHAHHEPDRELQHKHQLVDLTDELPCLPAGSSTACPLLSSERAGVCSASNSKPDTEQKKLPAVSMPTTGPAVPPAGDLVFGYSVDMLCDSEAPTNIVASAAGSSFHRERPLKGVEFCGSMMHALPAPFTISFGCDDSLDSEYEPFCEGLQFGEPQLQQQDVCCGFKVDSVNPAAGSHITGSVPLACDVLATSPMVEGQIGISLIQAAPDYEQLIPHALAVQFLATEYTAVIELLRKNPDRVVVYADSNDSKCLPLT